jgi:hypothetical protein
MDFFCDFNCAGDIVVNPNPGLIFQKSQELLLGHLRNAELFHASIKKR